MQVEVNGTRLWFDVDGPAVVPDGDHMRERPTVVLVHGGPGGYDHSYFKPHFARLTGEAQVVYLDLRDHGRSARHDPAHWSFEACADDLRAFCDAVGIVRPTVLGHSMSGWIVLRHRPVLDLIESCRRSTPSPVASFRCMARACPDPTART